MLELYHSVNSVCAQKVRIVLAEKGLAYQEHLMTLQGDQFTAEYMKLNPNGVVPTLVHDGRAVIESAVILYYLDEAFPQPPLMPSDLHQRASVRQFNKLIDEYLHNSCMILTFATAFRPWFAGLTGEQIMARLAKSPLTQRTEYKRDVALNGLESKYVRDAVGHHGKLLKMMDHALELGPWLAGNMFSLADAAVIPYLLRLDLLKLKGFIEDRPRIAQWYARMRERPSVKKELLERMTPADKAPFEKLEPDPWPKVRALAAAA
jgi:glutathione S-transferase